MTAEFKRLTNSYPKFSIQLFGRLFPRALSIGTTSAVPAWVRLCRELRRRPDVEEVLLDGTVYADPYFFAEKKELPLTGSIDVLSLAELRRELIAAGAVFVTLPAFPPPFGPGPLPSPEND